MEAEAATLPALNSQERRIAEAITTTKNELVIVSGS
jgi:hypothetical protein